MDTGSTSDDEDARRWNDGWKRLTLHHSKLYVRHVLPQGGRVFRDQIARCKSDLKQAAYDIFRPLCWRHVGDADAITSVENVRSMNLTVRSMAAAMGRIIVPEYSEPFTGVPPSMYDDRTRFAEGFFSYLESLLISTNHEVVGGWQDVIIADMMNWPQDPAELPSFVTIICERDFIQTALMKQIDMRRWMHESRDDNEPVFRTISEVTGAATRFVESVEDILDMSYFAGMLRNVRERGGENSPPPPTRLPSYPGWLMNIMLDRGRRYVDDYPIARERSRAIAAHNNGLRMELEQVVRTYSETPTPSYEDAWLDRTTDVCFVYLEMAYETYDAIMPERGSPTFVIQPDIQQRRIESMDVIRRIIQNYLFSNGTATASLQRETSHHVTQMITSINSSRRGATISDIFTQSFQDILKSKLPRMPVVSTNHPTANRPKFTDDTLMSGVEFMYRNLKFAMYRSIFEDVFCTAALIGAAAVLAPTIPVGQPEREDPTTDTDDDRSWHTDGEEENNMDIDNEPRERTPPRHYVTRDPRKGKWSANER